MPAPPPRSSTSSHKRLSHGSLRLVIVSTSAGMHPAAQLFHTPIAPSVGIRQPQLPGCRINGLAFIPAVAITALLPRIIETPFAKRFGYSERSA